MPLKGQKFNKYTLEEKVMIISGLIQEYLVHI